MKVSKKIKFGILITFLIVIIGIIGTLIITKNNEKQRSYELEQVSTYNYFILRVDDKYGVINTNGDKILDTIYDNVKIPNPEKDVFICYENEKITVFDYNKNQKFTEYESVEPIKLKDVVNDLVYEKSVLAYKKDVKYGLIDFSGNIITEALYDSIESISYREGELLVSQNGKFGVINIKGKKLVDIKYDEIRGDNYYSNETGYKLSGYIVGIKNDTGILYGYINPKGKLILKVEFNQISRIIDIKEDINSYLIVSNNGQYGVYKNKKKIINCEYQSIAYDRNNNIFILEKSKNYGIADINGKIKIEVNNTSLESKGIYLYAKNNENETVYDSNGKTVDIDFNKTIMQTSNENYYISITYKDDNYYYGIMDKDKNQIAQEQYLYIEYLYDNYFIASNKNGKLGIIDDNSTEIIELKYDLVQKIQDKNAIQTLIYDTSTTEIYNHSFKKSSSMQNANIMNFKDYIKMYSNNDLQYFDNNGNKVTNTDIFKKNELFSVADNENNWGFADAFGNKKINTIYERVTDFNEYGFAGIKQDKRWGIINSNGNIVLEPTYDFENLYNDPEFIGKYYKVQDALGEIYYTK